MYYDPGIDEFLQLRTHLLDEDGCELVTEARTSVSYVNSVIRLVDDLMNTRQPLFQIVDWKGTEVVRMDFLGRRLLQVANGATGWHERHLPHYRINPLFSLFKRFVGPLGALHGKLVVEEAHLLNKAVEKIRAFRHSPALNRRLANMRRCRLDNEWSARKLCDAVRSEFRRVLVVRIDVGYVSTRRDGKGYGAAPVTFAKARRDRDKFLAKLRKGPDSKHVVGYVWKMEYGIDKGYHFHIAVFFDGRYRCRDIYLANRLGALWKTLATDGLGTFFNCNLRKERYERSGLGMVSSSDHEKWRNVVDHAIGYLWKSDMFLRFRTPGKLRAFGVGGPYRS